jgi:hypothetical protein
MKIQVIKKGTKNTRVDIICPFFIDVPMETPRKS